MLNYTISENKMAVPNKDNIKDRELLIRVDERVKAVMDKVENIETILQQHKSQVDETKTKIQSIYNELYGTEHSEGLVNKVEKHDKLLTKAIAIFTFLVVCIELGCKFLFRE